MEELTKAELLEKIASVEENIDELKNRREEPPDHDLYRSVMWLECMGCGNRYVDPGDCGVCRPAKTWLQKYRADYPWASDKVRE